MVYLPTFVVIPVSWPHFDATCGTSGRDFGQVSESAMGQALRWGSERWMVRVGWQPTGMADAA